MTKRSANMSQRWNSTRSSLRSIAISACYWPNLADTTKRYLISRRHCRWCLTNQQPASCSTRSRRGARTFPSQRRQPHSCDYGSLDSSPFTHHLSPFKCDVRDVAVTSIPSNSMLRCVVSLKNRSRLRESELLHGNARLRNQTAQG